MLTIMASVMYFGCPGRIVEKLVLICSAFQKFYNKVMVYACNAYHVYKASGQFVVSFSGSLFHPEWRQMELPQNFHVLLAKWVCSQAGVAR